MQQEEQDTEYLDSLMCPSFNCYSTDQLASITNQVGQDQDRTENHNAFSTSQNDDPDFEFAAFRDKAFFNDYDFPLFNSDLPRDRRNSVGDGRDSSKAVLRFPITGGDVRQSEHDPPLAPSPESSSEADELERVQAGMYCVWTPNSPQASPGKCKKSNSTGSSSRKWKLLDLLRRSNSEGKEAFVFLTPVQEKKKVNDRWSIDVAGKPKGKSFAGEKVTVSAHEALYVRNRELIRKSSFCLISLTWLDSALVVWARHFLHSKDFAK